MEENNGHKLDPEIAMVSQAMSQKESIEVDNCEEIEGKDDDNMILRGGKNKKNYNINSNYQKNYNKNTNSKNNNNNKINITSKKKVLSNNKKEYTYDLKFDYKSNYFYQDLPENDWNKIKSFLKNLFTNKDNIPNDTQLKSFFSGFPNLIKGNIPKLQKILDDISKDYTNFPIYQKIMQFFLTEFYKPKPAIFEVYFFPNEKNEKHIIEYIRSSMKSLNIAIFSLTRDNFAKSIIEVFKRGVKVKIISDDECVKNYGSDVYRLAAEGIPCKTDNNPQYHMHNKYAVIDESIVITGSFNWTSQAILYNNENLLVYEDKDLALKYNNEFNNLWNSFPTFIDKQTAIKNIEKNEKK